MAAKGNTIKTWLLCLLVLAVSTTIAPVRAQDKPAVEYQVKAAFLFNFTRFVHWPASAYSSADAPFNIGIIGNDPFGKYLDDLVIGEQVEGHPIVVRRFADGEDVSRCHMLFININIPGKLKSICSLAAGHQILTVSDADNFIISGGIIRFFKEDNRIKFEVKLAAAKASQLDISAKLLQVAKVR